MAIAELSMDILKNKKKEKITINTLSLIQLMIKGSLYVTASKCKC